jgi:hypothetical protein
MYVQYNFYIFLQILEAHQVLDSLQAQVVEDLDCVVTSAQKAKLEKLGHEIAALNKDINLQRNAVISRAESDLSIHDKKVKQYKELARSKARCSKV